MRRLLILAILLAGCTRSDAEDARAPVVLEQACATVEARVQPTAARVGETVDVLVLVRNCGNVALHQPGPGCYREERLPALADNGTLLALGNDPERPRTATSVTLPGVCFSTELPAWRLEPGQTEERRLAWNGTRLEYFCQDGWGICRSEIVPVKPGRYEIGAVVATQRDTYRAERVALTWS